MSEGLWLFIELVIICPIISVLITYIWHLAESIE
jgi:hypothetical protein